MGMLDACPDVLRADMQRFYGLDLDELGHGLRIRRAADLAANLPEQALVWRRIDPRAEWDVQTLLLAQIADATGFTAWSKTKEASHRGAKWRGRIPRPWERHERVDAGRVALSTSEIDDILSRPRT